MEQNIYFFGTIDIVSHAYHIFQNNTLVFLYDEMESRLEFTFDNSK